MDITKINPIDENLIFERFILPKQKYLPDIDIDIPKGSQENLIQKLKQKYPKYNTYFIAFSPQRDNDYEDITFNTNSYKKHPCGLIIIPENLTKKTFSFKDQEFYPVIDISN